MSEEVFFFAYGSGQNGKGVFTHALLGVAGDYGQTASPELFLQERGHKHPTELADLARGWSSAAKSRRAGAGPNRASRCSPVGIASGRGG